MQWLTAIIDFVLHLNQHLKELIDYFGPWSYAILFLIIFLETGIVLAPFLPGDSLLFAAGSIAVFTQINVHLLVMLLVVAAFLGDACNYWIGHWFGEHLVKRGWIKHKYIDKVHQFFEKYGGRTIIIVRFIPVMRTIAPFVAGMGEMSYKYFMIYNLAGAILWVTLVTYIGYFFGNIPVIKDNFTIVIFVIIFLSILPAIIEFLRYKYIKRN